MKIRTLAVKAVNAVRYAVVGIWSIGTFQFTREGRAMKRLLAVLFILLVPSLSIAGEEIVLKGEMSNTGPKSSALPDIFFSMAHICTTGATNCLPSNLVNNTFAPYVQVYLPSTQGYTRYYFITDIQGAVQWFAAYYGTLSQGDANIWVSGVGLPTGQIYRYFVLFLGDNGKMTVSDSYNFKVF